MNVDYAEVMDSWLRPQHNQNIMQVLGTLLRPRAVGHVHQLAVCFLQFAQYVGVLQVHLSLENKWRLIVADSLCVCGPW